jgi:hypothetical protein
MLGRAGTAGVGHKISGPDQADAANTRHLVELSAPVFNQVRRRDEIRDFYRYGHDRCPEKMREAHERDVKIREGRSVRFRHDPLNPLDGCQKGDKRRLNFQDHSCPLLSQQGDVAAKLESVAEPLFAIHENATALEGGSVPTGLGVGPLVNSPHCGEARLVIGKTGYKVPRPE